MAMNKTTMRTKIKQAYFDRTGEVMSDTELALLDVCQGMIEEIIANAEVTVTGITVGGASATGSIVA